MTPSKRHPVEVRERAVRMVLEPEGQYDSQLAVNYLEKPFMPDGLARRVREVLDCQPSAQ